MKIIDTHQHLWDLKRFKLPWLDSLPALNRSYLMKDYLDAAKNANIEKSVYLEVNVVEDQLLDEAHTILKLADDPANPLAGVVAGGFPENTDFRKYLDQIAGHKKLKGIRRVLHTMPDDHSRTPLFAENVRALKQYGLSFDLCFQAKQLPAGIALVEKCPDVQFILDHCGVPDVKGKALDPWRAHIKQLAAFPNVACKVSGLVAYADPKNWTVNDLRPFADHVLACFGWDRVMWGSDWPVCTLSASFQQWVDASLELTRSASEADRHKLFYANADRIYRLAN